MRVRSGLTPRRSQSDDLRTCPTSSNAMTMTAAPKRRIVLAFSRKSASPSLRLMELTMHLPCVHLSPASMMAKLDESIHKGTCGGHIVSCDGHMSCGHMTSCTYVFNATSTALQHGCNHPRLKPASSAKLVVTSIANCVPYSTRIHVV